MTQTAKRDFYFVHLDTNVGPIHVPLSVLTYHGELEAAVWAECERRGVTLRSYTWERLGRTEYQRLAS